MNDWIKIDAEHMPPDMEYVLVTVDDGDKRWVHSDYRWNQKDNCWEWLCEASAGYWKTVDDKITHWMPYPAPAQD